MDGSIIPRELRERDQWVCWKYLPDKNGKPLKVPFSTKGRAASTTDSATWSPFDTALKTFQTEKISGKPRYDGIGYVFTADDGISGIDLDDCLDENGNLKPWAVNIVGLFSDTYSEISPSGTGIKLFVLGILPEGIKGRTWQCEDGAVEIYHQSRYFTVTANRWGNASSELRHGQAGIDTLLERFQRPKVVAPQIVVTSQNRPLDRQSVIERAALYLSRIEPAIEGQGGDCRTFRAACVLVIDFGLTVDEAWPLLQDWNLRCTPPWDEPRLLRKLHEADNKEGPRGTKLDEGHRPSSSVVGDLSGMASEPGTAGVVPPSDEALIVTSIKPADIPPDEHEAAFPSDIQQPVLQGLVGEFVEFVFPETEASRAALLMHFLAYFTSMAGRSRYYEIGGTRHHPRLFTVIVGDTSNGRKGTANDVVREFFRLVDLSNIDVGNLATLHEPFVVTNTLKGIVSGEGVIHQVRDESIEHNKVIEGVADKRLLIVETELGGALKVMGRDGNTLSQVLRDCWDGLDLRTAAKNEPRRATEPHINLLGHITCEELRLRMSHDDVTNGLANRILWAATQRSKHLPFGGSLNWSALCNLAQAVRHAVEFAHVGGKMTLTSPAKDLWVSAYKNLTQPRFGLVGKACERAAPQVLRLAMSYALLAQSDDIDITHLQAALEVWRYCEDSATWAFGTLAGDRVANEIERALRHIAPKRATATALHDLFGRNKPGHLIREAIGRLERAGRIIRAGKSPTTYRIA